MPVVPLDGFNPAKIKDLVHGIEITLGTKIIVGAIFDRDYRSDAESKKIASELEKHCEFAHIHGRKELENFLLWPEAIARAIESRRVEQEKRTGKPIKFHENVTTLLLALTDPLKHKVQSKYLGRRLQFQRSQTPGVDDSTITEKLMTQYETEWSRDEERLSLVPGKEVLAALNTHLQDNYGITITSSLIIDSFTRSEIPHDMVALIEQIECFRADPID